MDAILERMSVRKFDKRKVEPEKIEKILRAIMAAPSAENQQPWEIYVVSDPAVIAGLAETHKYSRCARYAKTVLVLCYDEDRLILPEFVLEDMGAATENALVEMRALGLGGVWLGVAPHQDRIEHIQGVLGLEKNIIPFNIVPFGYPAPDRADRRHEDRYDESRVHYVGE